MRDITFSANETRFFIRDENGEIDENFGEAVLPREASDAEIGRWVKRGEIPPDARVEYASWAH